MYMYICVKNLNEILIFRYFSYLPSYDGYPSMRDDGYPPKTDDDFSLESLVT